MTVISPFVYLWEGLLHWFSYTSIGYTDACSFKECWSICVGPVNLSYKNWSGHCHARKDRPICKDRPNPCQSQWVNYRKKLVHFGVQIDYRSIHYLEHVCLSVYHVGPVSWFCLVTWDNHRWREMYWFHLISIDLIVWRPILLQKPLTFMLCLMEHVLTLTCGNTLASNIWRLACTLYIYRFVWIMRNMPSLILSIEDCIA